MDDSISVRKIAQLGVRSSGFFAGSNGTTNESNTAWKASANNMGLKKSINPLDRISGGNLY